MCACMSLEIMSFRKRPHTKSTIAKMKVTQPKMQPDTVSTPPASEWKVLSGDVSCGPGHYFTGDLGSARLAFHTKSFCLQVQLNSRGLPRTLRMKTNTGSIVIHKLGADAAMCQLFSIEFDSETRVPLPWSGESLATLLFKAFKITMKPQRTRRQLTEEERQGLWETQGQCASSVAAPETSLKWTLLHHSVLGWGGHPRQSANYLQGLPRPENPARELKLC